MWQKTSAAKLCCKTNCNMAAIHWLALQNINYDYMDHWWICIYLCRHTELVSSSYFKHMDVCGP